MRGRGRHPSIRVAIASVVMSALFAAQAAGFSCAKPDPWFVQRVALSSIPELPPGVTLRIVDRTNPSGANPPGARPVENDAALNWIEVHNTSATPLFLLDDAAEFRAQMGYEEISWADDDLGAAPRTLRTRDKVQNGVSYWWPTNCAVVRCASVEWIARSAPLAIADGRWGISHGFENRIVRKNDRPANLVIPAPQAGTFALSYAGRMISVPFVVTYELNPRYDPNAGTENCGEGLTVIAFGLLGAFVLMVSSFVFAALLLMRRLIRRPRHQPRGRAV
jgi:hypothetical protein